MEKVDKPRRKLKRPEPGDRIRFADGTIYRVREDGAWVKMPAGYQGKEEKGNGLQRRREF
jgi:hypothetical protein